MSDEGVAEALKWLDSEDLVRREDALTELSGFDTPAVRDAVFARLQRLASRLQSDSEGADATFVSQLLNTSVGYGDARAVQVAVGLMSKNLPRNDHQLETNAINALVQLRATQTQQFLGEKLFEKSFSEHREDELAQAIAQLGGIEAHAILLRALQSKRPSVAIAAANAAALLEPSGDLRAALVTASQARSPTLSFASRLALIALSDDPPTALRAELMLPEGVPGSEAALVHRLSTLAQPQLTALLLEVIDDERWRPWKSEIFAMLVTQRAPGTEARLQMIFNDPASTPWVRATAAAQLLRLNPERDELIDFLLAVVQSDEMRAQSADTHPNEFDSAQLVGDALMHGLRRDPARFVRWLQLLNRWRRVEPRVTSLQALAGRYLEELTGSRFYKDFDAWLAKYCAQHRLDL